jgi:PD-(D/E)XK nuclease superfamily
MNPFERHGIGHLSPSSINLFANEPALWVCQYLMGRRFGVGCAAHRGSAAENGVQAGLLDPAMAIENCQAIALQAYDSLTALSADTRRAKEREAIPGIVAQAVAELRQYGPLTGYQTKIVHRFDDVPVDVWGFLDFQFAGSGVIVDLKTTLRLPSEISPQHGRQVAFYVRATNNEGRLLYATPAKLAVYRVENAAQSYADMNNIARRIMRFLAVSNDAAELAGIVTPRTSEFWWSAPEARTAALEVFGL